jgi:hypothetical protein
MELFNGFYFYHFYFFPPFSADGSIAWPQTWQRSRPYKTNAPQ